MQLVLFSRPFDILGLFLLLFQGARLVLRTPEGSQSRKRTWCWERWRASIAPSSPMDSHWAEVEDGMRADWG